MMNECCEVENNLDVFEQRDVGLVVKTCRVCHKRHFELSVDNAEIFGKGAVDG